MRTASPAADLPQLPFGVMLTKEQAPPNASEALAGILLVMKPSKGAKVSQARRLKLQQISLFPEAKLTRDEKSFCRQLRKYLPKGASSFIKVIRCVERHGSYYMAHGLSWDGETLQLELRDVISPEGRPELIWHARKEEVPFGYDTLSKKWNRHSTSSTLAVVREDLCDFRRKDVDLKQFVATYSTRASLP